MSEIIKVDEDTVKIVDETETVIKISDLEADLARLQADNENALAIDAFYDSAPEAMKPYITRLPQMETETLEAQIAYYKGL